MRNFIHLSYDGANYRGWQRQSNVNSIQQTIEDSISKMLGSKVYIHGCGRTDAEVHASQYFAHIDLQDDYDFDFVDRINRILPDDIAIHELIPVEQNAHAQHDVNWRTYEYCFHLEKTPMLSSYSAYYKFPSLDIDKMKSGVEIIKHTKDFRTLCKSPDIYKHTRCNIDAVSLKASHQNKRFKLEIKSNRFLRGMIRYIVARIIEIGSNKLSLEQFQSILDERLPLPFPFDKKAYPQGLSLSKVEYDHLERKSFRSQASVFEEI